MTTVYPELFEDEASADISIESPTKINMVFLKSGASWQNVVGYFTYPTGTVPCGGRPDENHRIPECNQVLQR